LSVKVIFWTKLFVLDRQGHPIDICV